ncbi:BTAD domain-containing putative transcriptional regulator [Nocardiopsis sp. CC223A]|uniref:AfsR/SARP family transcriptional regulator n=1 Tax=Nocardiopsis sp. CC223A TaxID=3044051 RepID=UPI00278BEE30|nr:BTAD domain-containing putative transcriptional regulator [Nocardiopsis sp. CC223A]
MTVEISVLGDIRTRIDGRTVDLGHVRRQSVFIGLLADVNRLVPVDRLIDRVWGRHPPAGARSSLYSYVSRLRTALSSAGGDAVVDRRPGGYVLSLSDDALDTVDLHRFRRLTSLARDSPTEDTSLARLEEALALWRADAFGSLDNPWVNEFRESLHLERLRTKLDRNDLLLRRGRQAECLGDLVSLAQAHPLDERLIGQLMLALYREGRTAQALEHYDRLRRALSEELGTDPGAELRDLHLRILDTDPALDAPPLAAVLSAVRSSSAAAPPPVPPPGQLPSPPPRLAGRERELTALDTVWEPGSTPVTVVCGLGGVGKTSLALHWAHDNLDRFPDGQLYVNLHGFSPSTSPAEPQSTVHDFLIVLGMAKKAVPTSAEAQIGLYRSLLAGKRMLILLDNARDSEQVRPLIPGSPSCVVLVTSRNRLSGLVATEGARSVTLDPLTSAEAHRLLAARIGAPRVAAEPEAAESIITGCGRIPLALVVAAARAASDAHLPLAELAAELREAETRLDALDTGDLGTSLRGVLDASHLALPAAAARVLGLLCLLSGQNIGLASVAALSGHTPPRTRALLRTLEAAHLVQQPVPGRYELHDLVRLHGRERAEADLSAQDRREALRSLVDFYVRTAAAANRLLGPHEIPSSVAEEEPSDGHPFSPRLSDEVQALEWFTAERSCLLAVIRLASDLGLHREVWRLCWDAHLYFRRSGHVEDFIGLNRTGLDAASRLSGGSAPTLKALVQRSLASTLLMAGRPGEEPSRLLADSLGRFEDTGDLLNQAHTHQVFLLSAVLAGEGRPALEHAERSLELYRRVDAPLWATAALNNLGWVLAESFGRYERALDHCREALEGARALGYKAGEAAILDTLGNVSVLADRRPEAIGYFRQAIPVYRALRDAFEEANTFSSMAEAHEALGEPEAAREAWRRALDLYRAQHRTEQVRETEERLRASP